MTTSRSDTRTSRSTPGITSRRPAPFTLLKRPSRNNDAALVLLQHAHRREQAARATTKTATPNPEHQLPPPARRRASAHAQDQILDGDDLDLVARGARLRPRRAFHSSPRTRTRPVGSRSLSATPVSRHERLGARVLRPRLRARDAERHAGDHDRERSATGNDRAPERQRQVARAPAGRKVSHAPQHSAARPSANRTPKLETCTSAIKQRDAAEHEQDPDPVERDDLQRGRREQEATAPSAPGSDEPGVLELDVDPEHARAGTGARRSAGRRAPRTRGSSGSSGSRRPRRPSVCELDRRRLPTVTLRPSIFASRSLDVVGDQVDHVASSALPAR